MFGLKGFRDLGDRFCDIFPVESVGFCLRDQIEGFWGLGFGDFGLWSGGFRGAGSILKFQGLQFGSDGLHETANKILDMFRNDLQ